MLQISNGCAKLSQEKGEGGEVCNHELFFLFEVAPLLQMAKFKRANSKEEQRTTRSKALEGKKGRFMTLDTLVFKKKNSRLEMQKKNVDVEFEIEIEEPQDKAEPNMGKSSTHEEDQNEGQEDTQIIEATEQIQDEEGDEAGKRQEEVEVLHSSLNKHCVMASQVSITHTSRI